MELLPIGIVMGVYNLSIRRISDRIAGFHCLRRVDHVFIKYGMSDKSAQFLINLPAICRTHIRAEKSLDTQGLKILRGFDPGSVRIIEFSGIAFYRCGIFSRQLSGIGYCGAALQRFDKIFYQLIIYRHGILRHHDKDIGGRLFHAHPSGSAMVEFPFGHMIYFYILILL